MDFGRHLDPLELDVEPFLEIILAWKSSPTCVCHSSFALHFVVLQMLFTLYRNRFETPRLQTWAFLTEG